MCGIMGYVGDRDTTRIILEGLAKHEYRGYDSAGIAVIKDGKISELRTVGRVAQLAEKVAAAGLTGDIGIGHTRWATHGGVTENNAHPHISSDDRVVLVHNGIIENARDIRAELESKGIKFHTETDTESAVQYLGYVYDGDPKEAIVKLTARIRGAFALVIMFYDKPREIWVARKGSPLVVGHAGNEGFCASDPTALLEFTHDVWFMDDDEMAQITREGCKFFDFAGREHEKASMHLDWDAAMTNRGKYPHFMLKEIHEQPDVVAHTLLGRVADDAVDLGRELAWTPEEAAQWKRIHFVACGTSHYATIVAQHIMETFGNFEIRTEVASEYRYRNIPSGPDTLAVFVSQSGETADTLHAARLAKARGAKCLVITNVRGSTIHREVGDALITPAGPEIGVAATKTFTAQITILTLLGLYLAKLRGELYRLFAEKGQQSRMSINVVSFGYKYGVPLEADLVFDVRFMPNPYYVPELRYQTGMNDDVYNYVFSFPQTKEFLSKLEQMLAFLLPLYQEEGKAVLVVAVGCTGGRHRSVSIARAVTEYLNKLGYAAYENHRDITRG